MSQISDPKDYSLERAAHRQLVEDGFIQQDNHGYWKLTEKGKKAVEKELSRYKFRLGLSQMIGMYYAELMGVNLEE